MSIVGDINGVEALADWLGDAGVPVDPLVAEFRAARCVSGKNGQPCPLNRSPNWWEKVKHVVADWIKMELELKNNMKLEVTCEQRLHMCKASGCCLRLKVWAPAKHLKTHISRETLDKTPDYCWMRKELL
jgi:hypothetical protein